MHKNRISGLRRELQKRKLPALLITIPANRYYLSGFAAQDGQMGESAGALLISQREALLLTDFRYKLTALSQAPYFAVHICEAGLGAKLGDLVPALGLKRLAVESQGLLLSQMEDLRKFLPQAELIPSGGLTEGLRAIKDAGEIELIARSLNIMEESLQAVISDNIIGQREVDVAYALEAAVRRRRGSGFSFEAIVASGLAGAEPHASSSERPVAANRPLVVDVGARYQMYASDITRTYLPGGGEGDRQWRQIYATVHQALNSALRSIRAGMSGREADACARRVIEAAGYGPNFGHSLGHGVGLMVHEAPSLSPRSREILAPGMVFTLEPGIYLPGWGGVRLEQMVELTGGGCRLLNKYDGFYRFATRPRAGEDLEIVP